MEAIGGYFELELPLLKEYHSKAIALSCGRACLEYILKNRKYTKVYVPFFTCDSVIEPLHRLGVAYEFYSIDSNYHIKNLVQLAPNEAMLYTNYWGLNKSYCQELANYYGNSLILDYTQAFFDLPISGIDTFYSCRKFFGVPDGGYLYTDKIADFEIEQDESYDRMDSLIKRIDISPEAGYTDFRRASSLFKQLPIRRMSKFTRRMMQSIDYHLVADIRRSNYKILSNVLGGIPLKSDLVPMVFPYECERGQDLRKLLIENKVFIAKYWPNVEQWTHKNSVEYWKTNHLLPLPVDQRYGKDEMDYMLDLICHA